MTALDARNVILAEILGEVDTLLTRVEKFAPDLDAAHGRLTSASAEMIAGIERYRLTIVALTEAAQASAVNHVVRRTNEVCEGSLAAHTDAMRVAAQDAFAAETGPRIDALNAALDGTLRRARARRWRDWLIHLVTVLLSSSVAAAVVAAFLLK
jgi:hypothetical protein